MSTSMITGVCMEGEMNLAADPISVVIIDDNARSLEYLAAALSREGAAILTASTPDEGLKLVYGHRPQVVFSDVVMPDKSGVEILKEIKKFDPTIQVVLMSAGNDTDKDELMRNGASCFLRKPIFVATARECLRRLLQNQSARGASL